jgi:ornithine cyclodeaminase/alanine dehydrogenase-like protein (mu-crystallin family)
MNGRERKSGEEESERRQQQDNDVLFIKESAVGKLLSWNDCVDAMESALVAMSSAPSSLSSSSQEPFASQTPRSFTMAGGKGVLLTMPGFAANYTLPSVTGSDERHSTLSCKLVTSFAGNSQLNPPLPSILATILLFDSSSGKLKAIVDGTDITAWRTAAVSVVATKHLHRPERNSTLAILGAGTQVSRSIYLMTSNLSINFY